jgi:hypothetical protein
MKFQEGDVVSFLSTTFKLLSKQPDGFTYWFCDLSGNISEDRVKPQNLPIYDFEHSPYKLIKRGNFIDNLVKQIKSCCKGE